MRNEVRRQVGKSPIETMNDFIDKDFDSIDADVDLHTGIVVNNNDPDKQGKCQIRVYGVFGEEVPDNDLPWALPDFGFIGSTLGSFVVPPNGALVKVYFDRGDIYLPHYTTKAVNINSQPTQKDVDYPDNMVMFETDEGDYFTINRKSKETTFHHNSGTKVLINADGSTEIFSIGDLKLNHSPGSIKVQGTVASPIPPPGGPLCALPACLFTGAPHSGNVAPTGPAVP